jgi:hypothetical protein
MDSIKSSNIWKFQEQVEPVLNHDDLRAWVQNLKLIAADFFKMTATKECGTTLRSWTTEFL